MSSSWTIKEKGTENWIEIYLPFAEEATGMESTQISSDRLESIWARNFRSHDLNIALFNNFISVGFDKYFLK